MLNKRLCTRHADFLAALVGGKSGSPSRRGSTLGPPPQSHLIPIGLHPPFPLSTLGLQHAPTRKGGSWPCSFPQQDPGFPSPPLAGYPRGWHVPNTALHGSAASQRPGAQPRLCPRPRAARLQQPCLCALGSVFPVSASQPAQLFPTVRPGAGAHRCPGRRRVYASDQCMHPRLPPRPSPARLPGSTRSQ